MNATQMTLTPMVKQGLHKSSGGAMLLKAEGEKGTARVAFAQLNVVDHDGDYTIPGAFQVGQKLKVCQTGHAHGMRVAGAGEIVGEQDINGSTWAVADLKFFLETEAGREEYATVKALQDAGQSSEWSYGYDILDAAPGEVNGKRVQVLKSLSVYEISPVLRGAGIGTHTVAVKAAVKVGDGELVECDGCGSKMRVFHGATKDWSTNAVYQAWSALHPYVEGEPGSWVEDIRVDPSTVVVRKGDDLTQIPYAVSEDGEVTFNEAAGVPVVLQYVPKADVDADAPADDEGDADAKGRAEQTHLQWLEMKARRLSRRPVH